MMKMNHLYDKSNIHFIVDSDSNDTAKLLLASEKPLNRKSEKVNSVNILNEIYRLNKN